MIPLFPSFKSLELTDKASVDAFIKNHPPYSDYNFVSMWSYDTDKNALISNLKGNLVLKYPDYITKKFFYSFLGTREVQETAHVLLQHAENEGVVPELRLIPHTTIDALDASHPFLVSEDQNNFDYILSTKELGSLEGGKFHKKRNMVNRFLRDHDQDWQVRMLDVSDSTTQASIEALFLIWEEQRGKERSESEHELQAIYKLFQGAHVFNLYGIGIFIQDHLVGFVIAEILHQDHAIIHFEKADISFIGIYELLHRENALYLQQHGIQYINYEQDLGLEGLRIMKSSYRPVDFLKKYTITHLP